MLTASRSTVRRGGRSTAHAIASAILRRLVAQVRRGRLTIRLQDGTTIVARGADPGPHAEVRIHRLRALLRLLTDGDAGLGASHVDGDWDSPDLLALLLFALANEEMLQTQLAGSGAWRRWRALRHRLRANTIAGSRRNIMAHYDLGNAFYAAWLDRGMTYSAALYEGADRTLEAAQTAKQDRVLAMLGARPGDEVLEIGCGWGEMLERLAGTGAASATGLTLSPSQAEHARARLAAAGVADIARVELRDYRLIAGRYDRIVSIEMLEAVGVAHWGLFFRTLARSLSAEGRAVIQTITIREDRFAGYAAAPDFIQMHVFPGGMLPTEAAIGREAAAAGLVVTERTRFGPDYARTLAEWRARFDHAWPAIRPLGFDERFRRLWRYYLTYCEAGFIHGAIDVMLLTLEPRADRAT